MKALTIYQPYATLLATGAKRFETRSYRTRHRGWTAIHAGKSSAGFVWLPMPKAWQILQNYDHKLTDQADAGKIIFPKGAMVGMGYLKWCAPVDYLRAAYLVTDTESEMGDFGSGRWAWCFEPVLPFVPFLDTEGAKYKASGKQGLWNYDRPEWMKVPRASCSIVTVRGANDQVLRGSVIHSTDDGIYLDTKSGPVWCGGGAIIP